MNTGICNEWHKHRFENCSMKHRRPWKANKMKSKKTKENCEKEPQFQLTFMFPHLVPLATMPISWLLSSGSNALQARKVTTFPFQNILSDPPWQNSFPHMASLRNSQNLLQLKYLFQIAVLYECKLAPYQYWTRGISPKAETPSSPLYQLPLYSSVTQPVRTDMEHCCPIPCQIPFPRFLCS